MTNITEQSIYEESIYQVATTDPAMGGVPVVVGGMPTSGHLNLSTQQLANRTKFLKEALDLKMPLSPSRYDLAVVNTTGVMDLSNAQMFIVDATAPVTLTLANAPTVDRSMTIGVRVNGTAAVTWPAELPTPTVTPTTGLVVSYVWLGGWVIWGEKAL